MRAVDMQKYGASVYAPTSKLEIVYELFWLDIKWEQMEEKEKTAEEILLNCPF
jgi:hypothetical protein